MEAQVTSILDITRQGISDKLWEALLASDPDYRDNVLKEHLYGLTTLEDMHESIPSSYVSEEVLNILEMMQHRDCAYLRIITY